MKNIKIELYNGENVLTQEINLHSQTGISKVIGTSVNKIFQFNERLRKYNSQGFIKASDNLALIISTSEQVLVDSMELNNQYGFKLSFGRTSKSKRKFASMLNDLISWAAEETKVLTIEELIKTLED
jgi:hypothetical protein